MNAGWVAVPYCGIRVCECASQGELREASASVHPGDWRPLWAGGGTHRVDRYLASCKWLNNGALPSSATQPLGSHCGLITLLPADCGFPATEKKKKKPLCAGEKTNERGMQTLMSFHSSSAGRVYI